MPLPSTQSYCKPLNSSNKLREYIFALFMLVVISVMFTHTSVTAATLPLKQNFVSNVGQDLAQQKYNYRLARYAFETRDYYFSFRLLKVLAEQGHKKAQNLLATQYDSGLGVKQDAYQAFRWYKKAAKAGVRIAQHNLAVAYSQGNGVKENLPNAVKWWKQAALNGHIDSQFNLGIIFATGKGAVKANLGQALKWWRMAAINGDAAAQFNLGALYANGMVDTVRTCEASRWWKKSAKSGFSQAEMALAVLQTKKDYKVCH